MHFDNASMLLSDRAVEQAPRSAVTRAIVTHRRVIYVVILVFYALAFTGQWRVGRDSSLYRGLGHSLAMGRGYHFTNFSERQIYPGLPVLLAGIEKVFGGASVQHADPTALPSIILIHLFSLGCLILTFKLVRLYWPEWMAIVVTAMVALNGWYLELTNEIRDDIPFLFGMMLALYGWERLRIALISVPDNAVGPLPNPEYRGREPEAPSPKRSFIGRALASLLIGLVIAAVMRPTFWILAVAWVAVCLWGLIRGPRRRFYAICLGVLLVVWLGVALLDPRVRGFKPLGGGYERDFLMALGHMGQTVLKNTWGMIHREMAYAFFGQQWVPFITELLDVVVILASLLLLRKNPLWTLIVLITVAVTVLMKPVPRYYVMILPLLAISWLLLTVELARRAPIKWQDTVLLAGIALMIVPNLARCCKVIGQQHHWNYRPNNEPQWQDVRDMSDVVHQLVPPGEKVIAPGAPIMAYLSGRDAVMSRDILPVRKSAPHWPEHLAALNIKWAVFPSKLYEEAERPIRSLMDRGVIVPTERVAKVGDLVLAKVKIVVPPAGVDWRKQPVVPTLTTNLGVQGKPRPSKEQLARKQRREAAQRHAAALKKHQHALKQKRLERHKRHEAAARKARHKRHARLQSQTRPAGGK
jgi:hypothetical protein